LFKFKLVGTTDQTFAKLPFRTIVHASNSKEAPGLEKSYVEKTVLYYGTLLNLMDFMLKSNPYFDVLELPIIYTEFFIANEMDTELLSLIQKTQTFRNWRMKKRSRDTSRSAFLSVTPDDAVAMVPPGQHRKALEHARQIGKVFQGDHHLKSVVRIHVRLLRRKLKQEARRAKAS
jgi:hypothetical protein